MKNTRNIKIVVAILLVITCILIGNESKAAPMSVTTSNTTAAPGETVNIRFTTSGVSTSNLLGLIEGKISVSGNATMGAISASSGSVNASGTVSGYWGEGLSSNVTITVPVTINSSASSGTVNVIFSGIIMTDETSASTYSGSSTATITVTAPSTDSGNDNSGGSTDSNNDNSSSNNNTTGDNNSSSSDSNSGATTTTSANLSWLKTGTTLSPTFSASVYEYTTTVSSETEKLSISFGTVDANATYSISGNSNLSGLDAKTITITVTSSDKSKTNTYTIKVLKEDISDEEIPNVLDEEEEDDEEEVYIADEPVEFGLKYLMLAGVQLSPSFSIDVFEYTAIYDGDSDILEVIAKSTYEDAEIEIIGNEDLVLGENVIKVIVTSKSGEVATYVIYLTKEEKSEEVIETVANTSGDKGILDYKYQIATGIFATSLIGLSGATLTRVIKNKRSMQGNDDFEMEEDLFDEGDEEISIDNKDNSKRIFEDYMDNQDDE